jgi:TRAP-type uncharacterized transport system fused permease subunit
MMLAGVCMGTPDLRSPRVVLAVVWSLFQLWTAFAGTFDLMIQLPLHVGFATALGFLTPRTDSRQTTRWWDMAGALLALACAGYFIASNQHLVTRMAMVEAPRIPDVAVSVLFAALLLIRAPPRRHRAGRAHGRLVAYAFVGP